MKRTAPSYLRQRGPAVSRSTTPVGNSSASSSDVYVRFVTPASALSHTTIGRIPATASPFAKETKISTLREQVRSQCLAEAEKGGGVAGNFTIDLHIAQFHLSLENISLETYDLRGTRDDPLNIYVVRRFESVPGYQTEQLSDYNGLSASPAWYPVQDATPASLSTFCSSLYMMRMKVTDGVIRRRFLTALWETTHFPPVVRAMEVVFDNGVLSEADKAVLTQTFFALAQGFVPAWATGTDAGKANRIMEGSRQIIGWLLDQVMSRKRGGSGSATQDMWAPKAIVEPLTETSDLDSSTGNYSVSITLPDESTSRQLRVRLMSEDVRVHPSPKQLALAFVKNSVHGGNTYFVFPRRFTEYYMHRIISRPTQDAFFEQVINTNSIPALSVIAPLSLTRSQPPCLTLNEKGLISVWDLGKPCTEEWARYWNPVHGVEVILHNDRGQGMAKKLQPLSVQRKNEGTWTVDGWDISGINISSIDTRRPSEAVVICFDVSGSMNSKSGLKFADNSLGTDEMSRLARSKELFKLFSQTVSNLDVPVYFGGFSFSESVMVFNAMRDAMTPLIDLFQGDVEALRTIGMTSLWDALYEAGEMLLKFKESQPESKLRIIALTDGGDNTSRRSADDVLRRLWESRIVVDTVVIGQAHSDHELFKFSNVTGGYGIKPNSVEDLTEIGQMETLVNVNLRPPCPRADTFPLYSSVSTRAGYDLSKPPPLAPHPNESDQFMKLSFAQRVFRKQKRATVDNSTSAAASAKRIMEEIQKIMRNPHPNMEVFVSESNLFFWKVIVEGPAHTNYQGGTFIFSMDMGNDFPSRPPKLRFLTPILHPNITKQGRVCHPILEEAWTSATSLKDVMNNMYGLLIAPEMEGSAVDVMSSLRFLSEDKIFTAQVAEHMRKHAQKDRDQLLKTVAPDSTLDPPSSPEPEPAEPVSSARSPPLEANMNPRAAVKQPSTPQPRRTPNWGLKSKEPPASASRVASGSSGPPHARPNLSSPRSVSSGARTSNPSWEELGFTSPPLRVPVSASPRSPQRATRVLRTAPPRPLTPSSPPSSISSAILTPPSSVGGDDTLSQATTDYDSGEDLPF